MGKIKIHEIAKKLGVNSKDVLEKAQELGLDVKTHMSSVDESEAKKIEAKFSNNNTKKEVREKRDNPVIIRREVIMTDSDATKKEEIKKEQTKRDRDVGFIERQRKTDYNIVYRNKPTKPLTVSELFGKKEEPKKEPAKPVVEKPEVAEKEEKKVNTEELKSEASTTVNQVKDTIKNVDIKKDSIETKGFIAELFKDPLGKIKEIVDKENNQYFKYAIIILVIWVVAELISRCFSVGPIWGLSSLGSSLMSVIKATIAPICSILVMSIIVLVMNSKNKKSLTTIITTVTTANIPLVIASVVSILTIFGSSISTITIPFTRLCSAVSIVLMYFTLKSIFGEEKNSEFIKKFALVELVYYIAYIVFSLLNIYI